MPTFADLGIDFSLFAADVDEAATWAPDGTCAICTEERPGFTIGIGDYVEVACASCGSTTPVPADGETEPCVRCGEDAHLGRDLEEAHGCWTCLRDGRWSSTKDTEAGMVTPVQAELGQTRGIPYPPEVLRPLVRTPTYLTWQGERWPFHCRRPMRYLGRWGKVDFDAAAPDGDGATLATQAADLEEVAWEHLSAQAGEGGIQAYMFECPSCGAHRGHWDAD